MTLKEYLFKKPKERIKFWRLIIVYAAFLIVATLFHSLLSLGSFELYRFREIAVSDIDLTDIHYHLEPDQRKKPKDVTIINSGSLDNQRDARRLEIIKLIDKLQKYNPKKIGLDLYFTDTLDTTIFDSLGKTLRDNEVVFGVDKQSASVYQSKPGETPFQYGLINLPNRVDESVRRYYNYFQIPILGTPDKVTVNSFAKAMLSSKFDIDQPEAFFLRYTTTQKGFYDVLHPDAFDEKTDFPAFEATDILNDSVSEDLLGQYINENRYIIVGHLGTADMNNSMDITDKHRVPVDFEFIKRQPVMPGVVIQANAIQMLHENETIFDFDGAKYWLLALPLLLLFLYVFLVVDEMKEKRLLIMIVLEMFFLVSSTMALTYLSIKWMDCGVHFNIGEFLVYLLLLIEFKVFAAKFYELLTHHHIPKIGCIKIIRSYRLLKPKPRQNAKTNTNQTS